MRGYGVPPLIRKALHVRSMSRPGQGRYPRYGASGTANPASPTYDSTFARPRDAAGEYFAGDVPVPYAHRVTPNGIAWAGALLVVQCGWLRLVLGYPGFGSDAAMNDRTAAGWLPLFLLACGAAPLVATALAADRERSDPYAETADRGHPMGMPLLAGAVTALAGVAAVILAATGGPHTIMVAAVCCGVVVAAGLGTGAGLLTVYHPVLRTPVAWAVLAVWAGLTLCRAFVWAIKPHAVLHAAGALVTAVPYGPMPLGAGVAGTVLIGGLAGFVRTRGQAPLLVAVAGLWLVATALSVVGPGLTAIFLAPWEPIAASLGGAVVGVLILAARSWWQEYR